MLQHGHDDTIAGANIVEEEVTVGMKLLLTERGRDGKSAPLIFLPSGAVVVFARGKYRATLVK